jgi:hypothetical protein
VRRRSSKSGSPHRDASQRQNIAREKGEARGTVSSFVRAKTVWKPGNNKSFPVYDKPTNSISRNVASSDFATKIGRP